MTIAPKYRLFLGTASIALAAASLYGCKEFLTDAAAPQGTVDQSTLGNQAGVEGTLIAAYRALDWTTGVGGNYGSAASDWVWGSVTSDDAYKGTEATDGTEVSDIEAYQWSTAGASSYLNDKWKAVYEGIVRSNSTLRLLKQVVAANPAAFQPADAAAGIEGEALFLRAHYHFEAWRMWGNVPYYREDDADFRKPNLAAKDVGVEILKDLNAAILKLPATPRGGQVARVTSWTAKAYKGRVQMYQAQYDPTMFAAALATLRDVRQNGPFRLEASFDRVWSGYQDYSNGKETIFAYQASANDGEASGNNANYGERLNFPHSGSPFGCCGFHQPSQNLVNFFKVDGAGLPTIMTNTTTWNADSNNLTSVQNTTAIDPRMDWTVGRDGVPYKDWGPHAPTWIRSLVNGGHYSNKKHVHEKSSGAQSSVGWVNTQLNSVNIHIFRYADLMLMLAEAEVEAGTPANALPLVNEIRARAGVTAQGPGLDRATIAVPINDARITWANYQVGQYPAATFATQASARAAVRWERRLELATEGQRFFDLRRWGVAQATLNAYMRGVGGGAEQDRRLYLKAAPDYAPRNNLYPIPPIQIELSKVGTEAKLTQNTGW